RVRGRGLGRPPGPTGRRCDLRGGDHRDRTGRAAGGPRRVDGAEPRAIIRGPGDGDADRRCEVRGPGGCGLAAPAAALVRGPGRAGGRGGRGLMLHRPSFLHALWAHAAITLVMIVAAICAVPALRMLLVATPAVVLLFAVLRLVWVAYSEVVARGMLSRRAPLRRVFANVLPGAFLGTAAVILPFTVCALLLAQPPDPLLFAGLGIDAATAVIAAAAGCLWATRTARPARPGEPRRGRVWDPP